MTMSFSEAIGRKVVAGDTAEDVGTVKTFVCNAAGTQVTQLQVAGRTRNAELVDFAEISSFGPDAVVLRSASDIHEVPDDRTVEMIKGKIDFVGSRVLATDGQEHGVVDEVHFDETTGNVVGFIGDAAGRVAADAVRSLGSYAVVVDTAALVPQAG